MEFDGILPRIEALERNLGRVGPHLYCRAVSEIREGIDPVVERLIRRCMEKDPNARPSSVAQLALALPGGDPLAAAIAAGETPSPEMVAASGSKEGLRSAVAWGLLGFTILVTLLMAAMMDRYALHRRIPFKKSPDVLVERAREIIKKAGYSEEFADSAYGFMRHDNLLRHIQKSDKSANRWWNLDSQAIRFWYRQSPSPFEVPPTGLNYYNPPFHLPGEVEVFLDGEGRLNALRAVPLQKQSAAGTAPVPDWPVFFAEAGLDYSRWTPADAQRLTPFFADTIVAWKGPASSRPGVPNRVEAAAFQGRPINFFPIGPWTQAGGMEEFQLPTSLLIGVAFLVLILVAAVVGGVFFARRNLRLGRGDRRNATRLAVFVSSLIMISWILGAHHVLTESGIINFFTFAGLSLLGGGLIWILYIALEPFVRRRWPQILVSWTRLLSGDLRNPLVARDALIGCALGSLLFSLDCFSRFLFPSWGGSMEFSSIPTFSFGSAMGIGSFVSALLLLLLFAICLSLLGIFLLFLLRILLRNQKAAIAVWILLFSALSLNSPLYFALSLV